VDQRLGEQQPAGGAKLGITDAVGQAHGGAQGVGPRLDRPRRHGRSAGLEGGPYRGQVSGSAVVGSRLSHRRPDDGAGPHTELAGQQRGAGRELALGRRVVAGHPVEPDEEGVVVLLEWRQRQQAHRVADGIVQHSLGQRRQGGLVQDLLGRGSDPVLFGQQPGLERRCIAYGRTLEKLRAEPRHRHGLDPGLPADDLDVDLGVGRQPEDDRIAFDDSAVPQRPPDLGQSPAECAEWVVGLLEQQPGQLGTGGRALAQQ
jgi:hypothetical protein